MTSVINLNQSQHKTNKQNPLPAGFTIIEVVLVLAIAGLIFLMVFIALPALQRNQRDTQRRNDINRILDGVRRFQANNRGALPNITASTGPSNANSFRKEYLKGEHFDPNGLIYAFRSATIGNKPTYGVDGTAYRVFVYREAKCDSETTVPSPGANNMALSILLEGGGVYCINN